MPAGDDLIPLLKRDGLTTTDDVRLTPLTGGVSSEIYLVEDGPSSSPNRFVVKRALAKLKVKDDWFADVGRNATEFRFLRAASAFMPQSVPRGVAGNEAAGYFAMEYLGDGFRNWKRMLLDGECREEDAAAAGTMLASLQKNTWHRRELLDEFDTTKNFVELRLSPYLLTTADRTPALAEQIRAEAARIEQSRECLVHGDFSPKNILINGDRMVLVDCEVAWFGDAAFDPAFLLTHLSLKALYHHPAERGLADMIGAFWKAYSQTPAMADPAFASRVLRLWLMLTLARVDGKSPVEYLDEAKRDRVRKHVAETLKPQPALRLSDADLAWIGQMLASP